jgi:hypothetical protein
MKAPALLLTYGLPVAAHATVRPVTYYSLTPSGCAAHDGGGEQRGSCAAVVQEAGPTTGHPVER